MRGRLLLLAALFCTSLPTIARSQAVQRGPTTRPNVLMICTDDMNDWVNCLRSYRGTVHTPNIDRLAARGRLFTNAHTAFPMCGPSRNAILLGMNPWRTGMYYNGHPWKPNVPDAVPMQSHFKANGYYVAGAGKIFHQGAAYNVPELWDQYLDFDRSYQWVPESGPVSDIDRSKHKLYVTMDWGAVEETDPVMHDQRTVKWTVEQLGRAHDRPFFITAGIILPHIPWYAPQRFFDLYPLESVQLPIAPADDLDDVPAVARRKQPDLAAIDAAGKRREAVRA
jgi:arylsulfatase A-like enzyme